jgi:hypothetical protein
MEPRRIQVRTPLFWVHVISSVLISMAVGLRLDLLDLEESFKLNPQVQQTWGTVAIILLILSVPVALAALGLEIAVRQGYDPRFMRHSMVGVRVADCIPDAESGLSMLRIHHRDGRIHEYLAELNEGARLTPGDVLRLDVFGQYVVGFKILESRPVDMENESVGALMNRLHAPVTAYGMPRFRWLQMGLFPACGLAIGLNLLPLLYREETIGWLGSQTYSGNEAVWLFGSIVVVSILGIGFNAALWIRGWIDYEVDDLSEGGDSRPSWLRLR